MPATAKNHRPPSIDRLVARIASLREALSQTTNVIRRRAMMTEISNLETRWALALHPAG